MILADTSVWIDHLRRGNAELARLLATKQLAIHPFVLGELVAGSLPHRDTTEAHLARLPTLAMQTEEKVRHLVRQEKLWGRGLSWIDLHLLAACAAEGVGLWTLDRTLRETAARLRIKVGAGG